MKTYVVDIEANGLYQDATEIHCIAVKRKGTDKKRIYTSKPMPGSSGSIEDALILLEGADIIVGHNFIDYDLRLMQKLGGTLYYYPPIEKIRDTLIRSYLSNPHRKRHRDCPATKPTINGRKKIGEHSLENWGYIVGRGKVEHEDWTTLTEEMMHRCLEDVEITDRVDDYLIREMGDWDWGLAENIEKEFRYILSEQEGYGWYIDQHKLNWCIDTLERDIKAIEKDLVKQLPPYLDFKDTVIKAFKRDSSPTKKALERIDSSQLGGDFCRVDFIPINLNSQKQVKDYLLSQGWKPQNWNYKKEGKKFVKDINGELIKTSPKMKDEYGELDAFEGITGEVPGLVVKRTLYAHRRNQINGWKQAIRSDGRIGAGGVSCGTNTGRVTHRVVVNVPKAEGGVFFGREMRSIFSVPEGYVLVGADLSALENRVAAHFSYKYDGGLFAEKILQGDPHQVLADRWGISRSTAKRINYAIMYGAQWAKIMSILNCSKEDAVQYFNDWWDMNMALKQLKQALERSLVKRGEVKGQKLSNKAYIKGIDGRKIYVRSWHSALNALFQNAGSIINKVATIEIYNKIKEKNIKGHIVGSFHDEVQIEVMEDQKEMVKKICLESFSSAGKIFNTLIPIEGEAKIGMNWSETH